MKERGVATDWKPVSLLSSPAHGLASLGSLVCVIRELTELSGMFLPSFPPSVTTMGWRWGQAFDNPQIFSTSQPLGS